MAEIELDVSQRYAAFMPASCAGLSESVEVDVLAHRVSLAGDLRLVL